MCSCIMGDTEMKNGKMTRWEHLFVWGLFGSVMAVMFYSLRGMY